MTPSIVALIPARAGSKRVPGKNTRLLAGKPLINYTIAAAKESGVFREIVVCGDLDDSHTTTVIDKGATWVPRPRHMSADDSPDIEWVRYVLGLEADPSDAFAILRPTSPFRTAETIRKTWDTFKTSSYDSMRAVEPATEHPGKMWFLDTSVYGGKLIPLLDEKMDETPWHSCPTQILPKVYAQNASLEMAWTRVVAETGTISGAKIGPIIMPGDEGFDINTEADWDEAERLLEMRGLTGKQPLEYLG